MGNIIEASGIPEGEKVYLKKDFLGWRVVEPIRNPETGKFSLFRFIFGGKRSAIMLSIILIILGLFYFGFHEQLNNAKLIMENPCLYCKGG
jgi:hypothetical protein